MGIWMRGLGEGFQNGTEGRGERVLGKELFLFLLDLEVKRARRYQNFLCLLFPRLKASSKNNGDGFQICYQTLVDLLIDEMRETDLLGSLGENRLTILLPYADALAGGRAKSRFEDALKCYDFNGKGFEVMIDQICFPLNGTDTPDLIKKALGI